MEKKDIASYSFEELQHTEEYCRIFNGLGKVKVIPQSTDLFLDP